METILVNIDSKKEIRFFLEFISKMRYKARILSKADREDIALLKIMKQREYEKTIPVETSYRILDKIK